MPVFVHAQGIKTVHVVVECPLTITAVQIANTHAIQTLSQILNSLKYEPLSDINRRIYLDCRLLPKEVLGHR